jgi:hypothetical protein
MAWGSGGLGFEVSVEGFFDQLECLVDVIEAHIERRQKSDDFGASWRH